MNDRIKHFIERALNCRIYRNSLPHGVDLAHDLNRVLPTSDVQIIFDVGANIGQSALTYREHFPRAEIWSFEPVAATFQKLKAATAGDGRIHPMHTGMGHETGSAVIHVNNDSRTNSIRASRPDDTAETIPIDTVTSFADKHGIARIDLLKIDTEGHDLEVLRGADAMLGQQSIRFVVAECEPRPTSEYFVPLSELLQFFASYKYELFGIYEQQPYWDGRRRSLQYVNAMFICGELAQAGAAVRET